MKKVFLALGVLFTAVASYAQTATVSATVVDGAAQAFVNGTYRIEYVKPIMGSGEPTRTDTGVPLAYSDKVKTGVLDASGYFTLAGLIRTDYIAPKGGLWKFTVCPAISAPCTSYQTGISAASVDLSSALTPVIGTLSVNTSNQIIVRGYADSEIQNTTAGSMYYNVIDGTYHYYNNSVWSSFAGGSSVLVNDAANTWALRNGTNAQILRVYNTYTDASNYERLAFKATGTAFQIYSESAGTGSARDLYLGTASSGYLYFVTNNSARWGITSNGHFLSQADNLYDIGASSANRPRTGYFATSVVVVNSADATKYLTIGNGSITTTGTGMTLVLTSAYGSSFNLGSGLITSNSHFSPNSGNGNNLDLGSSSLPWKNLWIGTSAVTGSEYNNGTCTTAATISAANGSRQKITLTNGSTCALSFTQPAAGTQNITLKVIQSAVSTFNGTISGCKWPGGTVPTITATNAAVDFISIYMDGTNTYCVASQDFR